MELHQLRCIAAIADHGTFTAAAASLHVSQPALSQAVAALEREVGARLFDRSPTGARLTLAGTAFLLPARRALAEADNSRAAVHALTGVISGELRVAGVRTAAVETARLLLDFRHRHPGISVVLEQPSSDRTVLDEVSSGRCDVGVVHSGVDAAGLETAPLGRQEIVAIFPERQAPETRTVPLTAFEGRPFVAPLRGSAERQALDRFLQQHAVEPLIVAECSDHGALIELVRGGLGATLVPDTRVAASDRSGLAPRRLRPRVRPALAAVRRPVASPAGNAFFSMCADAATKTGAKRLSEVG